jgi:hypothetical protein
MELKTLRPGRVLLLSVLFALSVSGCASFPGKELPTYSHEQVAVPANKISVTYDVKAIMLRKETARSAEAVDKEINKILSASPVFARAAAGAGTGDYHLSFVFRNEGNEAFAFVSGFISGLTLTVIPGYAKDNYILDVDVKQGDGVLKTYSYRDHVDTWIQLLLVFLTPSHWPGDVAKSTIDNMVMNFVHDFAKDVQSGVLLPNKRTDSSRIKAKELYLSEYY